MLEAPSSGSVITGAYPGAPISPCSILYLLHCLEHRLRQHTTNGPTNTAGSNTHRIGLTNIRYNCTVLINHGYCMHHSLSCLLHDLCITKDAIFAILLTCLIFSSLWRLKHLDMAFMMSHKYFSSLTTSIPLTLFRTISFFFLLLSVNFCEYEFSSYKRTCIGHIYWYVGSSPSSHLKIQVPSRKFKSQYKFQVLNSSPRFVPKLRVNS